MRIAGFHTGLLVLAAIALTACASRQRIEIPAGGERCVGSYELRWADVVEDTSPDAPTSTTFWLRLPAGISEPPATERGSEECWQLGALPALASPLSLRLCCTRDAQDGFRRGCMFPSMCFVQDERGRTAATPTELAVLIGTVSTAAQALGTVALAFPEVLSPSAIETANVGWARISDVPAYEIQEEADGFLVRAPVSPFCGCDHPVLRATFYVSRGGCVRLSSEPAVRIASPTITACVD